jgi:hypothetical protein
VRVFRLDRAGTISRLRQRACELLQQRPEVLEVRLFGSLGRGDAAPGSDADLFIVLRDGAPAVGPRGMFVKPRHQRLPNLVTVLAVASGTA